MKDKKRYIIQCTHELFKEKGYLDSSIQDILNASEVSKGTFYKYFLSKSALTLELLKGLDEDLNRDLSLMFQDYRDEDTIRKALCYKKKVELENAVRRIIVEAIVDKDADLMDYIKNRRQNSLIWMYDCIESAFGEKYPNAVTDATLFLQALIKELTRFNISRGKKLSIEEIVNYCFDKMKLCLDDMNKNPLFSPELIYNSSMITNGEQFMNATLHLKKWVSKELSNHPKYDLLMEYINFIMYNYEHLEKFPIIKSEIIETFESELTGHYPIEEYTQFIRLH